MFDDIISKKKKEVYEVETETVDYFDELIDVIQELTDEIAQADIYV